MKFKKRTAMILSFALGTTMFATTAIAEIISKSGYDVLKDSLKHTAKSTATTLSSYTTDLSFELKADGNVISSEKSLGKYDVTKQSSETTSTRVNGKNKNEYYSYSDKNVHINKGSEDNIYYLNEYTSPKEVSSFTNPFEEEGADDIERIADILVGNLKDAVIVNENSDGSTELSGSLNESQIPALINAVVSLQSKNEFGSRNDLDNGMPRITKDVYVKEITGKMIVNKDGLIENVIGTGSLSGKDANGKEHAITFELSGKLYDFNSTAVSKPDLSGKKVEKVIEKDHNILNNPTKYIGKYKTNILIEKEGKFEKVGERLIDITQINETAISGSFYEEYAKGYEEYAANKKDFKFDAKLQEQRSNADFTSTTSSGNAIDGTIYIDAWSGEINFYINGNRSGNLLFGEQYSRVFE